MKDNVRIRVNHYTKSLRFDIVHLLLSFLLSHDKLHILNFQEKLHLHYDLESIKIHCYTTSSDINTKHIEVSAKFDLFQSSAAYTGKCWRYIHG